MSHATLPVALDAMGGDHAPGAVVEGAVQAARDLKIPVLLVGRKPEIEAELRRHGAEESLLRIEHAPDIIAMDESPARAIRRKESSIGIGLDRVRDGKACAFVSAGNSGAVMACALFVLRRIADIERPAIAITVPTSNSNCLLIDAGANVDCKPQHLRDFAIMGATYVHALDGTSAPSVGLLANGEEESKGNDLTQKTHELLKATHLKYAGYVEGRDLYRGKTDVVVCDGFVGNAVLKASEGLAEMIFKAVKEELTKSMLRKALAALPAVFLRTLFKRLDYAEYGGAPLLGVKGVTIIAHGASNAKAIRNAVKTAWELHRKGLMTQMERALHTAAPHAPRA
ncbi:MAG: phosphate acyltransferase PlsX [Nitrospirae bacterium]|nr:phosphate acyltransferase PlsX [Nitrospirota bacterium]